MYFVVVLATHKFTKKIAGGGFGSFGFACVSAVRWAKPNVPNVGGSKNYFKMCGRENLNRVSG